MTTALQQICDLLPQLTADERMEVAARLRVYHVLGAKAGNVNTAPREQSDSEFMLQLIVEFCRAWQLDYASAKQLRRSSHIASFNEKLPPVMEFFRNNGGNRTQRHALIWIALNQLRTTGRPAGVPCTATFIMRNVHKLPAFLEAEFPGYAEAGLLPEVARIISQNPTRKKDG